MIGKEDNRLPARRNLDRATNHALAGQLLPLLRGVVFERLTLGERENLGPLLAQW